MKVITKTKRLHAAFGEREGPDNGTNHKAEATKVRGELVLCDCH